jgi:hypothetical protein
MDKIKNYAIAILTGLLVLSLFTQPAQSAGKSKEAKAVEYHVCVDHKMKDYVAFDLMINAILKECAKYRP